MFTEKDWLAIFTVIYGWNVNFISMLSLPLHSNNYCLLMSSILCIYVYGKQDKERAESKEQVHEVREYDVLMSMNEFKLNKQTSEWINLFL